MAGSSAEQGKVCGMTVGALRTAWPEWAIPGWGCVGSMVQGDSAQAGAVAIEVERVGNAKRGWSWGQPNPGTQCPGRVCGERHGLSGQCQTSDLRVAMTQMGSGRQRLLGRGSLSGK